MFKYLSKRCISSTSQTRQDLRTNFDFPIIGCPTEDFIRLGSELIETNKFMQENFEVDTIKDLLYKIISNYRIVSYHNSSHAFSVFLMLYQCQEKSATFRGAFSQFELFIGYIAALAHDISHSGYNNIWEIKNQSELAARHNNQSVLEKMHISELQRIFREYPNVDILSKIKNPGQRESAKRIMNKLILATDVSFHWQHLNRMIDLSPKASSLDTLNTVEKEVKVQ